MDRTNLISILRSTRKAKKHRQQDVARRRITNFSETFRGRDSRKAIAAVSAADLGRYHGVSDDDIAQWQQARTLVIIHDAEGKLLAAMPKSMETTYWDHGDRPLDSAAPAAPAPRPARRAGPYRGQADEALRYAHRLLGGLLRGAQG